MNSTATDEVGDYVEAVRAALGDLPGSIRDELLEDLPEHLAEVRAEGQGTLVARLGPPEAYAAELLAAAGFVGGFPDPQRTTRMPLAEARDNVLHVLRQADVRVGPMIGYARASDFFVLLRPAWWVARGYLVAMALAYLLDDNGTALGLLPRLGGSDLVALVLLAACVGLSVLLGRRGTALSRWPRYALRSGTVFLVLFALGGFLSADQSVRDPGYTDVSSYDGNPYSNVRDVFVYDGQGRLVPGARLFDQDGAPIQLGYPACDDPATGESRHSRALGYPYCPEAAPFGPATSAGAATPDESAPPSPAAPGSAPPARPGR